MPQALAPQSGNNGVGRGVWTSLPTKRSESVQDLYPLSECIGRGHFGNVYRCRDASSLIDKQQQSTDYAAKFIKKKRSRRSPLGCDLNDIANEYKALASSNHDSICRLIDAFEDDVDVILVLDIATGGDLFHQLALRDEPLLERELASNFLRQIVDALSYLHHRQGVLHLDLKPENILFRSPDSDRLVLIDFGLARFVSLSDSDSDDVRCMHGTAEFVAPEVLAYERLTGASDMWSLGVIGFMLLLHVSPFLGDTQQDTFVNIQRGYIAHIGGPSSSSTSNGGGRLPQGNAASLREAEHLPGASAGARDFLASLLMKNPQERLDSAGALRHDWLQVVPDNFSATNEEVNLHRFRKFLVNRLQSLSEDVHPALIDKLHCGELRKIQSVPANILLNGSTPPSLVSSPSSNNSELSNGHLLLAHDATDVTPSPTALLLSDSPIDVETNDAVIYNGAENGAHPLIENGYDERCSSGASPVLTLSSSSPPTPADTLSTPSSSILSATLSSASAASLRCSSAGIDDETVVVRRRRQRPASPEIVRIGVVVEQREMFTLRYRDGSKTLLGCLTRLRTRKQCQMRTSVASSRALQ